MENVILVRPVEWPLGRRVSQWSLMARRRLRGGMVAQSGSALDIQQVVLWDGEATPVLEYTHALWPETWTENMIHAFYEQEASRAAGKRWWQ